jgi:hypothetical protein
MFDQPLSQRIKARSGPGGILLMQPEVIEKLRLKLVDFHHIWIGQTEYDNREFGRAFDFILG